MVTSIKETINGEEMEDNSLRQQYGAKWTRKASTEINAQYKTII